MKTRVNGPPDVVGEASEESFPASDPPARVATTGTKVAPRRQDESWEKAHRKPHTARGKTGRPGDQPDRDPND